MEQVPADSLLKALEEGMIKFIGSTTENPYFSVNNAIISRVRNIYQFRKLSREVLIEILKNALEDRQRGLGALNLKYGMIFWKRWPSCQPEMRVLPWIHWDL